jgi:hypothetical protein
MKGFRMYQVPNGIFENKNVKRIEENFIFPKKYGLIYNTFKSVIRKIHETG